MNHLQLLITTTSLSHEDLVLQEDIVDYSVGYVFIISDNIARSIIKKSPVFTYESCIMGNLMW